MTRRNQQGRNALRKARRDTDAALGSEKGAYEPPEREACNAHQWEMPYDDANTISAQFNIWRQGGRIVDFAVAVRRLSAAGWSLVESLDICHGHCHLHRDPDGEPEPVMRLDSVDDVERAFGQVNDLVSERMRIIRDERE